MRGLLITLILMAFLSGCTGLSRPSTLPIIAPGSSAFSAGYSSGVSPHSSSSGADGKPWGYYILGIGILAGIFGGCLAVKTQEGQIICSSVVEAILAH